MGQYRLRRYTDIPSLIYLLREQRITLLDPQSWDDKNDSHYLRLYREKKNLKTVLAICFTQASETYHHWRVFAPGSSGVSISFKRKELFKALKQEPALRMGPVEYLTLAKIRHRVLATEELPFLKRYPFQDEEEFRVVYESTKKTVSTLDIPIPLSCIYKITLSPWLPKVLSEHMKSMLQRSAGREKLRIRRSTLISNEEWKKLGDRAPEMREALHQSASQITRK
jgi:hypothetical protein